MVLLWVEPAVFAGNLTNMSTLYDACSCFASLLRVVAEQEVSRPVCDREAWSCAEYLRRALCWQLNKTRDTSWFTIFEEAGINRSLQQTAEGLERFSRTLQTELSPKAEPFYRELRNHLLRIKEEQQNKG